MAPGFLSAVPIAIEVAKIAEAAVPLSGKGKEKFEFALKVAEATYETQEDLRSSWKDKSKFLEAIARAINLAVVLLNAAGVFSRAAPAAA